MEGSAAAGGGRRTGGGCAGRGPGPVRPTGERGQALVLFALLFGVACAAGALAVDGGFGFVQLRQAQNAADLGSLAATQALEPNCTQQGTVTDQQVTSTIDDLVGANAPDAAGRWSGVYLDQSGAVLSGAPALPSDSGDAPSGACGVHVVVAPAWQAFLAQVIGFGHLTASAAAGAVIGGGAQAPPAGHAAGIVALAPTGVHTIWGGGSGMFQVNGNIMDDSTGNCSTAGCYADTVDDFGSSSTVITGQLDGVAPVPLDVCFSPAGPTSATCPAHTSGGITYSGGMYGGLPYEPDPLRYLGVPSAADTACPGGSAQTFTSGSGSTYVPGVYDYPVYVTGTATFQDCGSGVPGIYIFNDGLFVCPGAGQAVTGSNVMLYNSDVPPMPGPNTPCGAQVTKKVPSSAADGIYLGGQGSVTLSGPVSGAWAHVLLYQDRSASADIGFDDHASDAGTIQLTGAIYDAPTSGTGGTLVSGGGTGGGTISVDGVVVVDRFATAGTANVTITFDPSQVPGVGAILVQ